MNAITPEKLQTSGSVTVKLDPKERDRIASLALAMKRTPHYLMQAAILDYVQKEESRLNLIRAAESSFGHYKESGLHITLDEFSKWVDEIQDNSAAVMSACHE